MEHVSARLPDRRLTTLDGSPVSRLGLGSGPDQDGRCVDEAYEGGITLFYFYDLDAIPFLDRLRDLLCRDREGVLVASGSQKRRDGALRRDLDAALRRLEIDRIDVFLVQYITPGESDGAVFGRRGAIETLLAAKKEGTVRYVGASAHDRVLTARLVGDPRVDVVMHRFNMAHRKAAGEVLPAAARSGTPVWAFASTRWGTLLKGHARWKGDPPTTTDCYRYSLSYPAIRAVVGAPRTRQELRAGLDALRLGPLTDAKRAHWESYGDLIYGRGRGAFETLWP
jgi:predicted aldo/keto reductase-like oxidoreductase